MPITLPSGSFYGVVSRRRELRGFTLTESVYGAAARVPAHAHEQPYLSFVLRGRYEETSGGHAHHCEPLDVVFHPAGEVHSDRFDESGGRCFNLELAAPLVERLQEHGPMLREPRRFREGPMNSLGRRLHQEFRRQDSAAPLAMEGLALELVAEVVRGWTRTEAAPPPWLMHACELLQAHFTEPWTLAEIAQSVGVHPAYLARSFRRHLHVTVGEYVRRLRIGLACRELAQGSAPLSAVAATTGFADQSHFTRSFKRATGLTPGGYRATSRAGQSGSRG